MQFWFFKIVLHFFIPFLIIFLFLWLYSFCLLKITLCLRSPIYTQETKRLFRLKIVEKVCEYGHWAGNCGKFPNTVNIFFFLFFRISRKKHNSCKNFWFPDFFYHALGYPEHDLKKKVFLFISYSVCTSFAKFFLNSNFC